MAESITSRPLCSHGVTESFWGLDQKDPKLSNILVEQYSMGPNFSHKWSIDTLSYNKNFNLPHTQNIELDRCKVHSSAQRKMTILACWRYIKVITYAYGNQPPNKRAQLWTIFP